MKIQHRPSGTDTHLSYCTNIHAGSTWDEAFAALQTHVPAVRDACLSREPGDAFGLGLRLSYAHLETLEQPQRLEEFLSWIERENLYVFTINGFPYGNFHGETVKSDVYRPDWTQVERLDYTLRLATLASQLCQGSESVTISTLPGTYKAWAAGSEPGIARHWLDCVVHCQHIERDTGVCVSIAIEPEPCCLLETASEVVDFFADWIQTDAARAYVAREAQCSQEDAAAAIQRHLGVCHDVCHSAVEFEPALAAVERYAIAQIPVLKLQLSSALRLDPASPAARRALSRFDEPVYLHQVVRRNARGHIQRYSDIAEALTNEADLNTEWRVHFHVPVFLDKLEAFGTTQAVLAELLRAQARQPISAHLEVETYTWDVLPAEYRDIPLADAIARELDWVQSELLHAQLPVAA